MQKTLDNLISESKEALESMKKKIELSSIDLSEDASEFWADLTEHYAQVHSKLAVAAEEYSEKAEKEAYLSMMEAKYKLLDLQDITKRFSSEVLSSAKKEIDIASYKSELSALKVEDSWEKIKDEISDVYETSKEEVQKLAKAASDDVKDLFAKIKSLV